MSHGSKTIRSFVLVFMLWPFILRCGSSSKERSVISWEFRGKSSRCSVFSTSSQRVFHGFRNTLCERAFRVARLLCAPRKGSDWKLAKGSARNELIAFSSVSKSLLRPTLPGSGFHACQLKPSNIAKGLNEH